MPRWWLHCILLWKDGGEYFSKVIQLLPIDFLKLHVSMHWHSGRGHYCHPSCRLAISKNTSQPLILRVLIIQTEYIYLWHSGENSQAGLLGQKIYSACILEHTVSTTNRPKYKSYVIMEDLSYSFLNVKCLIQCSNTIFSLYCNHY